MHYLSLYHLNFTHRLEVLKDIFALNLFLKKLFWWDLFKCFSVWIRKLCFQAWICISMFQVNKAILKCAHCVKSVQIGSFFWSVFSRIRTEHGPGKTPYLDTFYAVCAIQNIFFLWIETQSLQWVEFILVTLLSFVLL